MAKLREYLEHVEHWAATELAESAPPGKEAEAWIKHRKHDFKKRYGKRWQSVLYGAAWKRFKD